MTKIIPVLFYATPHDYAYKCLRASVKITENGLATGCHLFYHEIYGNHFVFSSKITFLILFSIQR